MTAMAEAEARAATEAEAGAEARAAAEVLGFEPGLNLDAEIAAYEREVGVAPGLASDEPVTVELEPEAVAVEPEPEPIAASAEPAASSLEPIPTAIGQPIPSSAIDGSVQWPEREAAAAAYEPHWPDVPTHAAGAAAQVGAGLQGAVSAPPPLPARACPSCGLSLSASARFCRRCGTPQQVDASR